MIMHHEIADPKVMFIEVLQKQVICHMYPMCKVKVKTPPYITFWDGPRELNLGSGGKTHC